MPCLYRQNVPNSVGNPKLHSPTYLIERSVVVPEDERVVAPPHSIKAKDVASMAHGKPDLEVQLNLLVLKKAELEVDAHKLEKDLLFWGGVYEEIKFTNLHCRQEEKLPCKENLPYLQFRRMPRPSPLRETPVNTEFDPWESTSIRDRGLSSGIPRKEVPIGEMLARFKTIPFNSPRPGTCWESSWFEDAGKMTSDGTDREESATETDAEFGAAIKGKKYDKQRGDSAIDMTADIECGKEDLDNNLKI